MNRTYLDILISIISSVITCIIYLKLDAYITRRKQKCKYNMMSSGTSSKENIYEGKDMQYRYRYFNEPKKKEDIREAPLLYTEIYMKELENILNEGMPKDKGGFQTKDCQIDLKKLLKKLLEADLYRVISEQDHNDRYREYTSYYMYIHKIAKLNLALELGNDWRIYCMIGDFVHYRLLFRHEIYYNTLKLLIRYITSRYNDSENKDSSRSAALEKELAAKRKQLTKIKRIDEQKKEKQMLKDFQEFREVWKKHRIHGCNEKNIWLLKSSLQAIAEDLSISYHIQKKTDSIPFPISYKKSGIEIYAPQYIKKNVHIKDMCILTMNQDIQKKQDGYAPYSCNVYYFDGIGIGYAYTKVYSNVVDTNICKMDKVFDEIEVNTDGTAYMLHDHTFVSAIDDIRIAYLYEMAQTLYFIEKNKKIVPVTGTVKQERRNGINEQAPANERCINQKQV